MSGCRQRDRQAMTHRAATHDQRAHIRSRGLDRDVTERAIRAGRDRRAAVAGHSASTRCGMLNARGSRRGGHRPPPATLRRAGAAPMSAPVLDTSSTATATTSAPTPRTTARWPTNCAPSRRRRRSAATRSRASATPRAASCCRATGSSACSIPARRFLEIGQLAANGMYGERHPRRRA